MASFLFGSDVKRDLLLIILVCAGAAVAMQKKPAHGIQMRDFFRKVQGQTACFGFLLENRSEYPLTAVVTVSAEDAKEGHEGSKLWALGVTNMQVTLAAHEQKTMAGSISFGFGAGPTVLSHYLRVVPLGPVRAPAADLGSVAWFTTNTAAAAFDVLTTCRSPLLPRQAAALTAASISARQTTRQGLFGDRRCAGRGELPEGGTC